MKFFTPSSKNDSANHEALFAQGAGIIACDGALSAGLWFDHTPIYHGRSIGTIGGCSIDNSSASAQFLAKCADYLHQNHQCATVVGPMNGNTWLKHRLILESSDRAPFLMEPNDPASFKDSFEAAGFSILSKYSSSIIDLTREQPHFHTLEKRLQQRDVKIRSICPDRFKEDLTSIFKLSLVSFSNNFLYTPLDQTSFVGKYTEAQQYIDPDLVLLAERHGELVGYVFCVPDLEAHQHQQAPAIIVKTLAALPERTLSGLGTVLVARAQQKAQSKGYREAIHALQFESNSSLRISQRFSAHIFRRYALMAKTF